MSMSTDAKPTASSMALATVVLPLPDPPATPMTSGFTIPDTRYPIPGFSGAYPRPLELPDHLDALLGQPVGRDVGRDLLVLRDLEHADHRVVDLARELEGPLRRPVLELRIHVDQAAGVDHVVGRVQNALLLDLVAVP